MTSRTRCEFRIMSCAVALLSMAATGAADESGSIQRLENVRLDDIDTNYASIAVVDCSTGPCSASPKVIAVSDSGLKTALKSFKKRDHLIIDIDAKNNLTSLSVYAVPLGLRYRIFVLAIAATLLFVFAIAATKGKPLQTIIGKDNRYSNSQFQIMLWFWVLLSSYLAMVYLRVAHAGWDFAGGINIPANLLLLSGLSVVTFGSAKGITTEKVKAAAAAGVANPKQPAGKQSLRDLFLNDSGCFDVGDFQMIVVTLLAVAMYVTLICHFFDSIELRKSVTLPDVDTTILAAFGLGQGAYLTKKAVGNVGET